MEQPLPKFDLYRFDSAQLGNCLVIKKKRRKELIILAWSSGKSPSWAGSILEILLWERSRATREEREEGSRSSGRAFRERFNTWTILNLSLVFRNIFNTFWKYNLPLNLLLTAYLLCYNFHFPVISKCSPMFLCSFKC